MFTRKHTQIKTHEECFAFSKTEEFLYCEGAAHMGVNNSTGISAHVEVMHNVQQCASTVTVGHFDCIAI